MVKDKKIRIQKKVTTGSGIKQTTTWVDLGNANATDPPRYFWAYYRHMSEREISTATLEAYRTDALFIVNWRSDIRTGYRIVYKGINYSIVNVDDYEGRKQDLKIYAKATTA